MIILSLSSDRSKGLHCCVATASPRVQAKRIVAVTLAKNTLNMMSSMVFSVMIKDASNHENSHYRAAEPPGRAWEVAKQFSSQTLRT
jgi:hypothetical protein